MWSEEEYERRRGIALEKFMSEKRETPREEFEREMGKVYRRGYAGLVLLLFSTFGTFYLVSKCAE